MDLGDGDVAFVDYEEEVFWEVVEEAVGSLSGVSSVEVSGVVFDAWAVAEFFDHFDVVGDSLFEAFGFGGFADGMEVVGFADEVVLDVADGVVDFVFWGYEEVGGEYCGVLLFGDGGGCEWVDGFDGFDLVAEEEESEGEVFVGDVDVDGVAFDAEVASFEVDFVAGVEGVLELSDEGGCGELLAGMDFDDSGVEVVGVAEAVEA